LQHKSFTLALHRFTLPDKSITQVNSKAVMPNPIANQESMHNKQRTTTNNN